MSDKHLNIPFLSLPPLGMWLTVLEGQKCSLCKRQDQPSRPPGGLSCHRVSGPILAALWAWDGGWPLRVCGHLGATLNASRALAQQHNQARINCRKLNGKAENTHIKKTNPSSSACLWMPGHSVDTSCLLTFCPCLMSSDNYHSQAINTSLMVSS